MSLPSKNLVEAFLSFESYEPKSFPRHLTPRERKIVLRDIQLSNFHNMINIMSRYRYSSDGVIMFAAGDIIGAAAKLTEILSPNPGVERMFQNPKRLLNLSYGFAPGYRFPRADDCLEELSRRLTDISRLILAHPDIEGSIRYPVKAPPLSTYEKAFGVKPKE